MYTHTFVIQRQGVALKYFMDALLGFRAPKISLFLLLCLRPITRRHCIKLISVRYGSHRSYEATTSVV